MIMSKSKKKYHERCISPKTKATNTSIAKQVIIKNQLTHHSHSSNMVKRPPLPPRPPSITRTSYQTGESARVEVECNVQEQGSR